NATTTVTGRLGYSCAAAAPPTRASPIATAAARAHIDSGSPAPMRTTAPSHRPLRLATRSDNPTHRGRSIRRIAMRPERGSGSRGHLQVLETGPRHRPRAPAPCRRATGMRQRAFDMGEGALQLGPDGGAERGETWTRLAVEERCAELALEH